MFIRNLPRKCLTSSFEFLIEYTTAQNCKYLKTFLFFFKTLYGNFNFPLKPKQKH